MHIAHCLQKMFRIVIAELMLVVFEGLPTRLYYDDKSGTQGFLLCVCAKVNRAMLLLRRALTKCFWWGEEEGGGRIVDISQS